MLSQIAPGQWRDHLPYRQAKRLAVGGNKVFCSTPNSLFFYDPDDNSINKLSKINGLTENTISVISYAPKQNTLVVAYQSSLIDLIKDGKTSPVPYLKNKIDISNKKINDIDIINDLVFMSCGFGIAVLDVDKRVFKDTYYPGAASKVNEVYDVCTDGKNIYASTESGIYKADLSDPYLVNFNRWTLIKNFATNLLPGHIEFFAGRLFVNIKKPDGYMSDSIIYLEDNIWKEMDIEVQRFGSMVKSNGKLVISGSYKVYTVDENLNISFNDCEGKDDLTNYSLFDEKGNLWAASNEDGLLLIEGQGKNFRPDGPKYVDVQNVTLNEDNIWVANGSTSGVYEWTSNNTGFSVYRNGSWEFHTPYTMPGMSEVRDLVSVAVDPYNPDHAFFTSYYSGLLEYNSGDVSLFSSSNSSIQTDYRLPGSNQSFLYGIDFDRSGNMWISNSRAKQPLLVRKKDKSWKSYELPGFTMDFRAGPVLVTSWQHKWVLSPQTASAVVFDDNGTLDVTTDDDTEVISVSKVEALTQSNYVYCLAEDKEGNVWIGTDAGPVVVRNAQSAFEPENMSVSKVKITLSEEENTAAFLLEQERINAIAVDGNNRKWFATENSGVYLMSPDGTKEISHFTAENSPLFSNNVLDIDIHPVSGEVFMATDKGLISYRGYATEGSDEFGDVYVFPNPVRENYEGDIIVTNLLTDADVRITDISGNLVYKTKALGGQAVWNGKNLLGKRVSTGVYLVFCSNEDGTKTFVTKLLFIH